MQNSDICDMNTIWIVLPILTLLMFDLGLAHLFRLPPVFFIGLVLMLVPVLLGIGMHYAWPKAAQKTDKVLTKLAFPLLLVLITVFYIQHHRTILDNIGVLGACVTVLILVAIGISSLLSRLVKNSPQQRRTVIIEVGMQNAAQAIPAILYSLMMNIVLLTYVGLVRKK